jgi:hypothetical protein
MAMDHTTCDHPRTPAGRAACRRKGGAKAPQTAVAGPMRRTPTRTRGAATPDVPDAFTPLLDAADTEGWSILRPISRSMRNEGEFSIKVRSEHGTVYAIWHVDGAIGLQWRSRRTSITRRIATVNQGIEYLRG